jgi:hypothetical protein
MLRKREDSGFSLAPVLLFSGRDSLRVHGAHDGDWRVTSTVRLTTITKDGSKAHSWLDE